MFKKLLFSLCLSLMLCACGKEPAPPETRTSQLSEGSPYHLTAISDQ